MKEYKISVIVPIYNTEKFLNRCIESIINQTYKNVEIILVDDGSTDSCPEICDRYAKIDSRIKVIHKKNEGVAVARNSGLDIATGDYIGFVDSDDFINPNMYEKMLIVAIDEGADIVQCGYTNTETTGNITRKIELKEEIIVGRYNSSYHYAKGENTTNFVCNKLFSKHIFDNIRFPKTIVSEDFVVNVKAYYKCKKTVVISDTLYNYVINENSVSNRNFHLGSLDAIKNGKAVYEYHKERFPELCPFFALYIVEYCMKFYKEVYQHEMKDKIKYLDMFKKEFNIYYPLITGDAFNKIRRKKIRVLMVIFNLNPILYYWIMRFFNK
jgi:glycosyltransferase involved in cell wall biosynthesis